MMKTVFMPNGPTMKVMRLNPEALLSELPPYIYQVSFSDMEGFYLDMFKTQFEIPKRIYGEHTDRVKRCLATYKARQGSTGILLTGDKGTGKTLLVSLLANAAITELKLPVLLITAPYTGPSFTKFIENIGECCIVFDEFGKMYSRTDDGNNPSQEKLLTLLDGLDKTKRLIMMTENSEFSLNEFILNRPSRIYYHFRYKKLSEASIIEYCNDKKVPKELTDGLVEVSRGPSIFSFDMLQAIVEEYIRYPSDLMELVPVLNVSVSDQSKKVFEVIKVERHGNDTSPFIWEPLVEIRTDNSMYLRITETNEDFKLPKKVTSLHSILKSLEEGENKFSKYIRLDRCVYHKDNTYVYKQGNWTISIREIGVEAPDYSRYMDM